MLATCKPGQDRFKPALELLIGSGPSPFGPMIGAKMEVSPPYSLPSSTHTPSRTPRSGSRHSSRRQGSSPVTSSSSPPMPWRREIRNGEDDDQGNETVGEDISVLDPSRFTPTLHASLVSEILSLRRDLESRAHDIEQLESSLYEARSENDASNESLAATRRETRSLRRQIQLLEGGTLSALSEAADERDNARHELSEVKKRLDQSQKSAKSHEESADRTHSLWSRDKQAWEADRRALETRIHIVEGRLKVVLSEVASSHLTMHQTSTEAVRTDARLSDDSPRKRASSGFAHRRHSSVASNGSDHHSMRLSLMGFSNGVSATLADELASGEEEEQVQHEGSEEQERSTSPDALPEERSVSRRSKDLKARKVLGLPLENGLSLETCRDDALGLHDRSASLDTIDGKSWEQRNQRSQYADAATQYTPPSSPTLSSMLTPIHELEEEGNEESESEYTGAHASQRLYPPSSRIADRGRRRDTMENCPPDMASAACQTIDDLPSPPATPRPSTTALEASHSAPAVIIGLKTSATQIESDTGEVERDVLIFSNKEKALLQIPRIAIIPPTSRPCTPTTGIVLPPQTKSVSCQVSLHLNYTTTGMQTEEIRVDKRSLHIPPHPSSTAFLDHAEPVRAENLRSIFSNMSSQSTRRRLREPPVVSSPGLQEEALIKEVVVPSKNDDGPLTLKSKNLMRRPVRLGSLFAGFEDPSDDEALSPMDPRFTDDDIFHRPTLKYTLKSGKLVTQNPLWENDGWSADERLPSSMVKDQDPTHFSAEMSDTVPKIHASPKSSATKSVDTHLRQIRRVPSYQTDFRRAALISSGTAAHQAAPLQSQTAPIQAIKAPPFPVPTRFSSRKIPISVSEGARSPTPTGSHSSPRKRDAKSKKPTLRKTRSAATISRDQKSARQRSRSPALPSILSVIPGPPNFPPTSFDHATSLQPRHAPGPSAPPPLGPNRRPAHVKTTSTVTSLQQTSVVDAIAQTMVGEWMFKYVRRRKSFGVPESRPMEWEGAKHGDETMAPNSGQRHKRWVWLEPYERAVMWSSKQPASGSALLGKSGRKLQIQSVLDVKDDNPPPKNGGALGYFNRSILILTPQRALKFTATSQERHYVWLTSLSFLSHSPLNINDLAALPVPQNEYVACPPPSGSLRRRPIRDSIRVAKGAGGRAALRSLTSDGLTPQYSANGGPSRDLTGCEPLHDAADPPNVPRFSTHARQRSSTDSKVPTAMRSLSHRPTGASKSPPMPFSPHSTAFTATAAGSSEAYPHTSYDASSGVSANQIIKTRASRGTSDASGSSRPVGARQIHDVDDMGLTGTMRMEAFIDRQNGRPRVSQRPRPRPRPSKRKDMAYWGVESGPPSPTHLLSDGALLGSTAARSEDPFRGF